MNWYATLNEAQSFLADAGASDAVLARLIEAASREADRLSRRHFYVREEPRIFTPVSAREAFVDDLLSVDEIAVDSAGDGTFSQVLDAADFVLLPDNSWPKWLIVIPWHRSEWLLTTDRSLRVTGSWGYGDGHSGAPWRDLGMTATVADAESTGISLSEPYIAERGMTLRVGGEQVFVEAVDGADATVRRAVNGSTASAHDGAGVERALWPANLTQAVLTLVGYAVRAGGHQGLERRRIGNYSEQFWSPEEQREIERRVFHRFRRWTIGGAGGDGRVSQSAVGGKH